LTPAPSITLGERDANYGQQARRARFIWLIEALRRDAPRDQITRGEAHSARRLPTHPASHRMLHLLYEYGVRPVPAAAPGGC
jgi:hypothetical protein